MVCSQQFTVCLAGPKQYSYIYKTYFPPVFIGLLKVCVFVFLPIITNVRSVATQILTLFGVPCKYIHFHLPIMNLFCFKV